MSGNDWKIEEECVRLASMPEALLTWYRASARELPWREDPSPYKVWISEIMLQQTRIEAVKEYFRRFMQELPDLMSLAGAEEERVLKLWEGLGYYSRARNLHKAAQICKEQYEGQLPEDMEKLLALPGIGAYTAGAIGSIAYHIPVPAVDGNVLRILTRILADDSDIRKESFRKKIQRLLTDLMPREDPGTFNQALMELGERICIPGGAPGCEECPVAGLCLGRMEGNPSRYPSKIQKKARREEKLTILLMYCHGKYRIRRRPGRGLLAGLYELPSLPGHRSREEMEEWLEVSQAPEVRLSELGPARHIFSHVEWDMKGWKIELSEEWGTDGFFASPEEIRERYPLPTAFAAYRRLIEE